MRTLDIVKLLNQQANEIASEGHNGWGNTMREAADKLEELQERITELEAEKKEERDAWSVCNERCIELGKRIIELEAENERLKAMFTRMENAWRDELDRWYQHRETRTGNKSLLGALNGKLKEAEVERDQLKAELEKASDRLIRGGDFLMKEELVKEINQLKDELDDAKNAGMHNLLFLSEIKEERDQLKDEFDSQLETVIRQRERWKNLAPDAYHTVCEERDQLKAELDSALNTGYNDGFKDGMERAAVIADSHSMEQAARAIREAFKHTGK